MTDPVIRDPRSIPDDPPPPLASWLLNRLAEDEALALAAQAGPWSSCVTAGGGTVEGADARGVAQRRCFDPCSPYVESEPLALADAEHIARHNPARVLAEVAAKRLQIDQTFRYEETIDDEWGCCHSADEIARGRCPATPVNGIQMLRLLALSYADHPTYWTGWKP